jgi:hypothetical protein
MQLIALFALCFILYSIFKGVSKKSGSTVKGFFVVLAGFLLFMLFGRQIVALGVFVVGLATLCLFCVFLAGIGRGIVETIEENSTEES